MTNKFFFKKYISIYRALDKVCIGFVGNNDYLEVENNSINYKLLENMLKNGISNKDLKKFPYNELYKKGFIENANTTSKVRSELYLNYLLSINNCEGSKEREILIFGAGAGGSSLIYLLAQFGFKNISIVDFDDVEETDLFRVMTFDKSDVGMKKIDSLKRKIKQNFSINIKVYNENLLNKEELSNLITNINPDFIVKACDPKGLFLTNLNEICFRNKIPYIMMAYSYEFIKIGPIYVPSITSCNEYLSTYAKDKYGEHYKIEHFERMFGEYLIHPSISFNINILSSLVFKEILFFLLEQFQYCQTIGRLMVLNPLTLETKSIFIKCKDDCRICKI
ncbi:ThiF family adenylyltransferase [Flavobacterium sp. W1B]|uniref:ThiF family adenylyltransferase n=1 Tax=Flavobacterium sp. W1B TaxID=3394146 RepID=UPI0039BCFF6E